MAACTESLWDDPNFLVAQYGEGKRQADAVFAADPLVSHVTVCVAHTLGGDDDFTGRLEHYAEPLRGRGDRRTVRQSPGDLHPCRLPCAPGHGQPLPHGRTRITSNERESRKRQQYLLLHSLLQLLTRTP